MQPGWVKKTSRDYNTVRGMLFTIFGILEEPPTNLFLQLLVILSATRNLNQFKANFKWKHYLFERMKQIKK